MLDNFAELVMLAAGKYALGNQAEMPVLGLKIGQPGVGSSDVAGELLERDGRRWRNFEK